MGGHSSVAFLRFLRRLSEGGGGFQIGGGASPRKEDALVRIGEALQSHRSLRQKNGVSLKKRGKKSMP